MSKKSRPCEICMKPIEPQRLEATPETRLCKEHGGEFIRVVSHERTSKAGSLKKNYGGVNTSRKRNQAAIEKLKDEFDEEKWQQKPV